MRRSLRSILLSVTLCIILGSVAHAESFELNVYPNGIKQSTYQAQSGGDSTVWEFDSGQLIGRNGTTDTYPNFVYRSYGTIYPASMGLPVDAEITGATLSVSFNQYKPDYTMKIVTLDGDPSSNGPQTNWFSIGAANTWVEAITTGGIQTPTIGDLVSKLQSAFEDNEEIYLGFRCNQDGTDGTTNSFYVTIEGEYQRIPSQFIVKNSFNGGIVKVEGDTVESGTPFPWLDGNNHNLEAIDQSWGVYDRVWNTSGTQESRS